MPLVAECARKAAAGRDVLSTLPIAAAALGTCDSPTCMVSCTVGSAGGAFQAGVARLGGMRAGSGRGTGTGTGRGTCAEGPTAACWGTRAGLWAGARLLKAWATPAAGCALDRADGCAGAASAGATAVRAGAWGPSCETKETGIAWKACRLPTVLGGLRLGAVAGLGSVEAAREQHDTMACRWGLRESG